MAFLMAFLAAFLMAFLAAFLTTFLAELLGESHGGGLKFRLSDLPYFISKSFGVNLGIEDVAEE
ncbi:MAG: hypothetical protein ACJA16_003147 [Akkermansiaceae bacterium]|jgi:hypothetical protein